VDTLSNIRFVTLPPAEPDAGQIRRAEAREIEPAVRLILASPSAPADPQQVRDLVRLAHLPHSPSLGLMVGCGIDGLVSAVLPVVSPGRTMLLFVPAYYPTAEHQQITGRLVAEICRRAADADVHLAQALLDPSDSQLAALFSQWGFSRLAELIYLQRYFGRLPEDPPLPPPYRWQTYSPQSHDLFARTIERTYQLSLDCPALNGMRSMEDIVAGHKAVGEFDPSLWFLLCRGESPLGVLILSPVQHRDSLELVYLGLVPEARGRGLGDRMMRHAAYLAGRSRCRLTLAVDASNRPALRLYWRHGMQSIVRRVAMLRDLRALADRASVLSTGRPQPP